MASSATTRSLSFTFATLLVLAVPGAIFGQDRCADILTSGVHNTYQNISKNNEKSQYKNSLCDESSALNTSNPNGSGEVNVIDIVDVKGQGGNSTVSDLRRKYCTQNSGDMSDDDFQSLVRITIDPYIV